VPLFFGGLLFLACPRFLNADALEFFAAFFFLLGRFRNNSFRASSASGDTAADFGSLMLQFDPST
jgi:hypothetical protein